MAVSNALRSTRLGNLKYDKYWLESGKVSEVLDLCMQFDRTLSLSAEDERVINTSPKSVTTGGGVSPGLGGGELCPSAVQTATKSGASSASSRTVDTPSSEAVSVVESVRSDSTTEDKRVEALSGFDLAVLRNETEWEQRKKAAIDNRLKLLRNQWDGYQKKLLSPPSPRSISPTFKIVVEKPSDFPQPVFESERIGTSATEYEQVTPPLPEGILDDHQGLATEQRFPSPPMPGTTALIVSEADEVALPFLIFQDPDEEVEVQVNESISLVSHAVPEPEPSVQESPENEISNKSIVILPVQQHSIAPAVSSQLTPVTTGSLLPIRQSTDAHHDLPVAATAQQLGQHRPVEKSSAAAVQKEPKSELGSQTQGDISNCQHHGESIDPSLSHIRLSDLDCERFSSIARLNAYKRVIADYQRRKEVYESFQNRMAAGFCSKSADRAINLLSIENVHEHVELLGRLLKGDRIEFQGKAVSIRKHPDAEEFVSDLIARTLLKQAENVASVRRDIVYPLAGVAVGLWIDFPRVGEFLKAVVWSNCLYLLPYYPRQDESDSDQDYKLKQGYQLSSNGRVEELDQFLKRMTGICRFWAAIMCTPAAPWYQMSHSHVVRSIVNHPLDFNNAWAYLANFVQLYPHQDITATVLLEFLEMSSHFLKRVYGRQFEKLLRLISRRYLPDVSKVSIKTGTATYARLKAFLDSGTKRFVLPPDYPEHWSR